MDSQSIISALDAEIAKLQQVRALLATSNKLGGSITRKVTEKSSAGQSKKRVMSPEARKRIADAQRKRWAAVKKQKSATAPKASNKVAKKPSLVKAKNGAPKKARKVVAVVAKPEAQRVETLS